MGVRGRRNVEGEVVVGGGFPFLTPILAGGEKQESEPPGSGLAHPPWIGQRAHRVEVRWAKGEAAPLRPPPLRCRADVPSPTPCCRNLRVGERGQGQEKACVLCSLRLALPPHVPVPFVLWFPVSC